MPEIAPRKGLPKSVQNELSELLIRLSVPQIRARLIDEFLSQQSENFSDGTRAAWPNEKVSIRTILRTVAQRRHWSLEQTCLEFAAAVDLVAPGNLRRLMREIGEPMEARSFATTKHERSPLLPEWDRAHGKLWFGGKVIRRVRICSTPTKIEQIIAAFDRGGWQMVILEPFHEELDQSEIHQVVNQLNKGLQRIRFRVQKGGREITWAVETQVKLK